MRQIGMCLLLGICAITAPLPAQPVHYLFDGDKLPSEEPYAAWYTTVGPGHPTGSYFVGTSWGSDGNVLSINTVHPNDYVGATSLGIWFGRTDSYGDPSSGINFDSTANGNRVEARIALAPNSSEWSLYWFDGNSYGAAFNWLANGFHIYTAADDIFVPLDSMTSFHTYASHIHNGQVSYYLDDELLASGPTYTGLNNWLLIGDGSAGDVSGYGTLLVDSMEIIANAGPAPVPEPTTLGLLLAAALVGGLWRRSNRATR